jgi:hypothetical protein
MTPPTNEAFPSKQLLLDDAKRNSFPGALREIARI